MDDVVIPPQGIAVARSSTSQDPVAYNARMASPPPIGPDDSPMLTGNNEYVPSGYSLQPRCGCHDVTIPATHRRCSVPSGWTSQSRAQPHVPNSNRTPTDRIRWTQRRTNTIVRRQISTSHDFPCLMLGTSITYSHSIHSTPLHHSSLDYRSTRRVARREKLYPFQRPFPPIRAKFASQRALVVSL